MQRAAGSVLIIVAGAGAGYMYGMELKRYYENIMYLRYVAGLILGEIKYTEAPLAEVFCSVASRIRQPYRAWLQGTAAAVEERDESELARIWNRCVDRYLKELGLKSEHSILVKEMGTFLGQLDMETFERSMQMYLNRMDLETERLRENLASKRKIGNCLGLMGGIFLVVILL